MVKKRSEKIASSASDKIFVIVNSALLIVFFLLTIYPLIFVAAASLSSPAMVAQGKVLLLPKGFTLDGYRYAFAYSDIWLGYKNTIFYTLVGTLLNLVFTLPCAYALSRRDLAGRNILMGLFIVTMYINGGMIPSYLNMHSMGLTNTRWSLLILGLVSTYNLIVARTFFANTIPWELHEAARIDGSSDFQTFTRIVIPLSSPIIVVLTLYYGITHWNQYFSALIYLRDRNLYPLQMFLREILIQSKMAASALESGGLSPEEVAMMMKQQDTANLLKYGVIILSTLPMLLIYPWLQKYFAKGVMIGSVKG